MSCHEGKEFQNENEYRIKVKDVKFSIFVDKFGKILKYDFKLNKEESIELIKTLIQRFLSNNGSSSQDPNNCKEIGIDNEEFFCLIWLIYYSYCNNNNIVLNLFNFDVNKFSKNFFEMNKPNIKILKNTLGIDEFHKDNLVIQPINLFDHYSLMLFSNNEIYLIDFGLTHCSDNLKNENAKKANNYYNELLAMLDKKNLSHKFFEIFNIEKEGSSDQKKIEEKLKEIVGFEDKELSTQLIKYFDAEKSIKNTNILDEKSCQCFPDIFYNDELCKKIQILNNFSIQGEQTCGYFTAAAFQYILMNNLNIKKIIDENKDGIFQMIVCKIVLDLFTDDNQKIVLINEKIDDDNYDIYDNKKNMIAIKKKFKINIKGRSEKKLIPLGNDEIIDIKTIKKMLEIKGYKKKN